MSEYAPIAARPPDRALELAAFGLASPAELAGRSASRTGAAPRVDVGELGFAVCLLSGALAAVYLTAGITLLGRLNATAWVLIAVGAIEAALSCAASRTPRVLPAVTVVNILVLLSWVVSRTVGMPGLGDRALPVGLLDSLCAADCMVVAWLGCVAWRGGLGSRAGRRVAGLNHLAILLAVLTTSALLGGHTHTGPAAASAAGHGRGTVYHLFCRLL